MKYTAYSVTVTANFSPENIEGEWNKLSIKLSCKNKGEIKTLPNK